MSDVQTNPSAAEDIEDTVWEQDVAFIDSIPRWLAMSFVFVMFIGTWQLVTSFGLVSPIILPTPWETLKDMIFVGQNLLTGGYMLGSLWITIKKVIYGFALAIAIGFPSAFSWVKPLSARRPLCLCVFHGIRPLIPATSDQLFHVHPTGRRWWSEARSSSLNAVPGVKGVGGVEGCPREGPARPAACPPRG